MSTKRFFETALKMPKPEAAYRGRNLELIKRRNSCLADRYYYYSHFTDKRYETIMAHLSREFFLSTRTINDLIAQQIPYLQQQKLEAPTRGTLERRWPHLKW
jgi:hypothetical protein